MRVLGEGFPIESVQDSRPSADNYEVANKRLIWIGSIVGSTVGGMLPGLWHASMLSMWGFVLSTVGGIAGIWAGWKLSQM
jgi:dipeptide/tripeptide permease